MLNYYNDTIGDLHWFWARLKNLTYGTKIKQLNDKLEEFKSQENINYMKNKLRDELKNAIRKDRYLNPDDAKLINDFITKLKKELSNSN